MTATTEPALVRLIAILKLRQATTPDLKSVIRELELLRWQQLSTVPDSSSMGRRVQTIVAKIKNLSGRGVLRFTDAQALIYEEFLQDMGYIDTVEDSKKDKQGGFAQFSKEHPFVTAAAGGALVLGSSLALGPALLVGGLNLLGFSAAGPVAGSIAAGVQSIVYGGAVASGSAFALAQSAAMGGVVVGSAAELAAAAAAAGAGIAMVKKASDNVDEKDSDAGDSGDDSNCPRGSSSDRKGKGKV